jgi:hypothetical protein
VGCDFWKRSFGSMAVAFEISSLTSKQALHVIHTFYLLPLTHGMPEHPELLALVTEPTRVGEAHACG